MKFWKALNVETGLGYNNQKNCIFNVRLFETVFATLRYTCIFFHRNIKYISDSTPAILISVFLFILPARLPGIGCLKIGEGIVDSYYLKNLYFKVPSCIKEYGMDTIFFFTFQLLLSQTTDISKYIF